METPSFNLRNACKKIKGKFQENIGKNMINIGFMLYYMIYAGLSLGSLLNDNEIGIFVFWKLLILCLNLPILVVLSLVLVGNWKGSQTRNTMLEKLYEVQLQLELRKNDIEHLKLIQQQASVIGDLTEQIARIRRDFMREQKYEREISEYRCQLAARDGKVPEAVISNCDWNEANSTIENIEGCDAAEPTSE